MPDLYDITSPTSIDEYTGRLIGKTLRELTDVTDADVRSGKGDLGGLVEKFFYKHTPPNNHEPDFAEAGLELKVTGLKRLKNRALSPKERLVLGMISYHQIVSETFQESYILRKIRLMLVVFYLYEADLSYLDMRFIAKHLWQMSDDDLLLIARDWQLIVDKVKSGKAHELSEADTLYLGACTKAASSKNRTSQPYSQTPAKPRAFALKASYVRVVMDMALSKSGEYGSVLRTDSTQQANLEREVVRRLEPYFGRDTDELLREYAPDVSRGNKSRYAILTSRLLGVKAKKILEFEKAGIIVRTIRLRTNDTPKEDISFPAFDYLTLAEQDWNNSEFKDIIESKFLFIVLKQTAEGLVFDKVKFWSMPYEDRLEAERVWGETVQRIKNHDANNLPSKKFSSVVHVRPHGKNGQDKLPAPGGLSVVKKCFWLNASYIKSQL